MIVRRAWTVASCRHLKTNCLMTYARRLHWTYRPSVLMRLNYTPKLINDFKGAVQYYSGVHPGHD